METTRTKFSAFLFWLIVLTSLLGRSSAQAQTSPAPDVALMVQLCAPGTVDHSSDCTINRTQINVGQTLSGSLTGGSLQELVFNPLSCGGGAPPLPMPISYTASVVYAR